MQPITITPTLVSNSNLKRFIINNYSGLLNSNYKNIVKANFKSFKSYSLFNIKQRVKSNQFQTCCSIETSLKVLIFFAVTSIAIL